MHRLVLSTLALALVPALAQGHAKIASSSPPENGTLAASAKEISLKFTEAVKVVRCVLKDDSGKEVKPGSVMAHGEMLHVALAAPLPAAKYALACRVVGADSHPVENTLNFVVRSGG